MPEFSPGARERKKRATRARLESAAFELFETKGFDGTTVDEIAALAHVSPRTFFRYFATKDDVVFSGLDRQLDALTSAVAQRPRGEPGHHALTGALVAFSDHIQAEKASILPRLRLTAQNPSLLPGILMIQRRWEDALAAALARHHGAADPTFHHRVLAGSGIAALAAAVSEWDRTGGNGTLPVLTREAMQTMAMSV